MKESQKVKFNIARNRIIEAGTFFMMHCDTSIAQSIERAFKTEYVVKQLNRAFAGLGAKQRIIASCALAKQAAEEMEILYGQAEPDLSGIIIEGEWSEEA